MADIKIRRESKRNGCDSVTMVELTGVDYINDGLVNAIINDIGSAEEKDNAPNPKPAQEPENASMNGLYRLRRVSGGYIYPGLLKQYRAEGRLDEIISPFDEIDIPLDTGGTVTVVCGYIDPNTARFIFKDCWDEGVMNDEATNKTGYFKSKGRAHVLLDILPHIAQEWRELFKPRQMVEEIDGERVEYADLMWLPSATDVFGRSEGGYWEDLGENFQLPIFERERDRVKECGGNGTYPYWLRSVRATNAANFGLVGTGGSAGNDGAYYSYGFAPGFDI